MSDRKTEYCDFMRSHTKMVFRWLRQRSRATNAGGWAAGTDSSFGRGHQWPTKNNIHRREFRSVRFLSLIS
jgi:hypothetical protein